MSRFVLLRHECPPGLGKPSHWDLMLEEGASLATWSIAELPTRDAPTVAAIKLADHRIEYLDYDGPLSGGRGEVLRVDAGQYFEHRRTATRREMRLAGALLSGNAILNFCDADAWTLTLDPERAAP